MYNFNIAGLDGTIGGEVGQVTMWRDGRYMKGTYPSNSFGNSEALDYFTYQAKLNLAYRFSAAHSVEFNAVALPECPHVPELLHLAAYAQRGDAGSQSRENLGRRRIVQPQLPRHQGASVGLLHHDPRPDRHHLLLRRPAIDVRQLRHQRHRQEVLRSGIRYDRSALHGSQPERGGKRRAVHLRLEPHVRTAGRQQFENPLGRRQQHRLLEGHARGEHAADGRQRRPVVPQRQQLVRIGRPEFLRQQLPVDEPAVPHRRGTARRSDQRRDCRDDPHDARTRRNSTRPSYSTPASARTGTSSATTRSVSASK